MFLLFFAACSDPELTRYAGCTVTTSTTNHETGESLERVEVYDAAARLVESRLEHSGIVETWTATYDGECLAREVLEITADGHSEVVTTRRTCDEHGHPEQVEQDTSSDGGVPYAGPTHTFANTHDGEGRLVVVQAFGDFPSTSTFEWGAACVEPRATRVESEHGFYTSTRTCRADGQVESGEHAYFDLDGTPELTMRWERTFDALGRLLTEVWDDGPDTPVTGAFTWTWDDLLAPGPTEEVLRMGPREELASVDTYAYDCTP